MNKVNPVGRPPKKDKEKKVQVISYIPKMNVAKFKKAIEPFTKEFSRV